MSGWAIALLLAAGAQDHAMHGMAGMTMPMPAKAKPGAKAPPRKAEARKAVPRKVPTPRRARRPAAAVAAPAPMAMDHAAMEHGTMASDPAAAPMDHAAMGHGTMASDPAAAPMDHAAMGHGAMTGDAATPLAPKLGTDLPPGDTPAPVPPAPHYADRIWDPAAMARGRAIMMNDDGGGRRFAQVMVNLAEYAARNGRDGYRWDGEAWIGGDIDRLVLKSEGEGDARGALGSAELRALYSHAIGPYFNLQGGVRQDIRPTPARTYATIGVAGLAPYWFEVEASAFVSTRGEVLGRLEGYYDQRITQRLVLQPRVELNLSAGGTRAIGLGSGLTDADLGLRLRYEVRREFAPYIGVTWERRLGGTARLARADRRDVGGPALVVGVRGWF
ncbi:copper resistance protein B [Sphingomonas sp. A2-49]|uniref:copper resistance protein B n=1 Tax=Sphingomonas sp. A2-49 TaxID=1391375 RepID=UPI0021D07482|nr:copper resistance protein B [Sphingomonas sp. A2-49]MCU6453726.1 copper resistance protein B [Sphingomonas sp. A2-49]